MRVALLLAGLAAVAWQAAPASPQLQNIKLPPGFQIAVYAEGVADAREMAIGTNGTVFVGSNKAGNVYALPDTNGDHRADRVVTIGSGFTTPTGIAFHDGALYVSEVSRINRLDNIERSLDAAPKPVVVNDTFPATASRLEVHRVRSGRHAVRARRSAMQRLRSGRAPRASSRA